VSGDERSDKLLAGEVALVTGGSRGIGLAIAQKLIEAGAGVALVARDRVALDQAVGSLSAHGGTALPVVGDVTDPRSMESAVERTVERLGGLSILVNNAAVGWYGPVVEQPLDEWRRVIEINLLGAFYATRAALSAIRKRGRAQIQERRRQLADRLGDLLPLLDRAGIQSGQDQHGAAHELLWKPRGQAPEDRQRGELVGRCGDAVAPLRQQRPRVLERVDRGAKREQA
jgi:NAD(P)-dependent dehydrogenase (short-subunit alcohol dehydrogenase family)